MSQTPFPPAAPTTDFPGKTLGIVGLVLAIFANIVGLIVSAVALHESKQAGHKNTPALAGVIVGSVLFVISVVVSIVLLAALIDTARVETPMTSRPKASDIAPAPDSNDEANETQLDVYSIVVGSCFNDQATTEVFQVPVVDCAAPHDFEVYGEFQIEGDSFPGADAVDKQADDGCFQRFEPFVGLSYEQSRLDYTYFSPTPSSWSDTDDRLVSCMITDTAGQISGSLAGSAR